MYEDYLAACDTPMSATFTVTDGFGFQESQTGSLVNFQAPANYLTVTETVLLARFR